MSNKNNLMAKEFVDIICPTHDRSSCSDEDLQNGFYSNDHFTRCARCTLLSVIRDRSLPKSHEFSISCYIKEGE